MGKGRAPRGLLRDDVEFKAATFDLERSRIFGIALLSLPEWMWRAGYSFSGDVARLKVCTSMNDVNFFWSEVRRWRRYFFVWWICWPIAGISTLSLVDAILGEEPPLAVGLVLMIAWAIIWVRILGRLKSLSCPACGKPAIEHPYFFMRHARCQWCGLRYQPSD